MEGIEEYFIKNKKLGEDPSMFKPEKVYDSMFKPKKVYVKTSCRMWFDSEGRFHKRDGALRDYCDPRDPRLSDKLR